MELPLALPLLFAGIRTAAVYVVATVPLGALTGTDGGLGDIIVNQASYRLEGVVGAAICVAVLAISIDALFAAIQRVVDPARAARPDRLRCRPDGGGRQPTRGRDTVVTTRKWTEVSLHSSQ